jgi:hypothetical protein
MPARTGGGDSKAAEWNPFARYGNGWRARVMPAVRLLNSTIFVAFWEEAFGRDWFYRMAVKLSPGSVYNGFEDVPLGPLHLPAVLLDCVCFASGHLRSASRSVPFQRRNNTSSDPCSLRPHQRFSGCHAVLVRSCVQGRTGARDVLSDENR